ncbi:MAG: ABC transporter ATP-binding protein [Candidatus Hydrogenedentes bacterium]|nr:ABC transporter ATP-binding protein [Candidatus Hydrogenedentota bacterium]
MSPSFWRFLKYSKPYWPLTLGAILCGVLKFSLALLMPWSLGYVIDKVLPVSKQEGISRLEFVLAVLALSFVARAVANYFRSYWSAIAGTRTVFDVRRELYRHIQRLSLSFHDGRRTGAIMSRLINDLNSAQGILEQGVISMCMDVVILLVVVVLLFVWDWRLASVSLLTMPLYGLAFRYLNPRIRAVATAVQEEMEEMNGETTEKLAGLRVVLAFVREKTEEINFFLRHRSYYGKLLRRERLKLTLQSLADFFQDLGPIVVIFYGGYRVITDPDFTVGAFVAFYGFLSHLYLPTRRLADYSALMQEKLAAMDRVFELFDSEPEIKDAPHAKPLLNPKGRITFEDVYFAYTADTPVLQGVTFDVQPGQSVAIVGRSGAGKSSLVNLVPRFYDITRGAIRIDGHDIRDLTLRSLRANIGMVLQDSILFTGTIRENILYGRMNATEAEMQRAAAMAHVTEFVDTLPDAFDTMVGERGVTLSGGQKQRVSIARAFLRNPRILILDEATSSLDSGAEALIQEALRELMKGRTTLVIAHRLSTIVDCDAVIVIQEGRIVQRGAHAQLIHECGPYRQFCREQFGDVELEDLTRKAAG